MLALSLGLVMREIGLVLIFHLFFIPLRVFCGGWHAGKNCICTLVSFFVLTISVIVGKYEIIQYGSFIWIVVMVCGNYLDDFADGNRRFYWAILF